MKKILLSASALVLLFTNFSHAQISFACLSFGGSATDQCNMIIQTADSGFAEAGNTSSFGAVAIDFCLTKLDKDGNLQWTHRLSGNMDDVLTSIEQTTDGGYLLGGFTTSATSFDDDFFMAKLDSGGNLVWDKIVGGSNFDFAQSVHQTFDKGYVLAGRSNPSGFIYYDVFIVKFDSSLNLQWSKAIGGTADDRANAMQQTADSGYVLAGETSSFGAGANDVYVVKLDSVGNLQWAEAIGGSLNDVGNSIKQTSDGGYIVAGNSSSFAQGDDYYVVKLDGSGNIEWTRTIGGTASDIATDVQQTPDGGYIVAGYSRSFGIFRVSCLAKLDEDGNLEWTSAAGALDDDFAYSLDQTLDGGFVVGGLSQVNGTFNDFMLTKFDATGNSCCPAIAVITTDSGGIAISGGVLADVSSTIKSYTWTDTLVENTLTAYCIVTHSNEVTLKNRIEIFPNPADDQFTISLGQTIDHGVVQLYNVMGEKILEEEFSNESTHEVNVFNISTGIYLLKLQAQMSGETESYYSEKLIVR